MSKNRFVTLIEDNSSLGVSENQQSMLFKYNFNHVSTYTRRQAGLMNL